MTIASEITRIEGNISAAYTAADAKGATMPATENSDNLATCIASIPSGGSSTKFGLSIDTFIGNLTSGVLSAPTTTNGITFTGLTEIGGDALSFLFHYKNIVSGVISFPDLITVGHSGLLNAFTRNQITSVDLSSLTTVGTSGLNSAFDSNQITSVDLSSLTTVGNNGLYNAFDSNQITSVDLSALTTVGEYGLNHAFSSNQITSVDLSALATIENYGLNTAFSSNRITSIDLSALATIGNYGLYNAFAYMNNNLQSIYFRELTSNSFNAGDTTAFYNMITGNDGVTVHFPSNLQSVIGSWTDVTAGFDGTNTTVLFDLPATS